MAPNRTRCRNCLALERDNEIGGKTAGGSHALSSCGCHGLCSVSMMELKGASPAIPRGKATTVSVTLLLSEVRRKERMLRALMHNITIFFSHGKKIETEPRRPRRHLYFSVWVV